MYADDDLLPLSALQHLLFCPRQCALIHVERLWVENRYTAEGQVLHQRVDRPGEHREPGVRTAYAVDLKSRTLGLVGKADAVEYRHHDGLWRPYPVEYKRGRPKKGNHDRVQLCAQALCLEEMHGMGIDEGALFYGTPRRREVVSLTDSLRTETIDAALALHHLVEEGLTPPPVYTKGCDTCSFLDLCMPKDMGVGRVRAYLREVTKG